MFAPIARLIKQRQAAEAVKLEVENSGLTEDQIGKLLLLYPVCYYPGSKEAGRQMHVHDGTGQQHHSSCMQFVWSQPVHELCNMCYVLRLNSYWRGGIAAAAPDGPPGGFAAGRVLRCTVCRWSGEPQYGRVLVLLPSAERSWSLAAISLKTLTTS